MTALPYDDLAAQLARAKVPICWQTLALLLTSRAPVRDQLRIHDIVAVHTSIGRAFEAPPTVSLVITEQILRDFRADFDAVETETRYALTLRSSLQSLSHLRMCPGNYP